MVPRMFSVAIDPLTITYFTRVAAGLGVGAVSALNFGLDYQVLPVSLIGVSFSLAVFPLLSAAYADGDRSTFSAILARNLATIGILTVLAAVALFVLSGTLVHVLLGGGKFTAEDVAVTSAVVAAFALSVPFDALAYPLSRGLYATHDTAAPGPRLVRRPRRGGRRDDAAGAGVRDPRHPPRLRGRGDRQGHPARAVPGAAGPAHRRQPGGLTGIVGRTVMYRPSRAGYLPSGRFQGRKFRIISALFWNVPGGSDGPQMLEMSGYHGSWM